MKKLTLELPDELHQKLKQESVDTGSFIKNIMVRMIEEHYADIDRTAPVRNEDSSNSAVEHIQQ